MVSFSGPRNRVKTRGNETTDDRLKQLNEIGDFIPLVSLSILELKQVREIRDLRPSFPIEIIKMKTIHVNYQPNL